MRFLGSGALLLRRGFGFVGGHRGLGRLCRFDNLIVLGLAHCLLGDFYLSLEEYEPAVETTRKGLKLAGADAKKTDLSFQR